MTSAALTQAALAESNGPSFWRRLEPGRLITGALAEWAFRLYGGAAATSAALSDAETARGKAYDALNAIPALQQKYHEMQYVVTHREQIQAAISYLNEHTITQDELNGTIDRSSQTLNALSETTAQLDRAYFALTDGAPNPLTAAGAFKEAWSARPDLDSLQQLSAVARQVRPLLDQIDVLLPIYYGNLLSVVDNFSRDEIWGTVGVMLGSLILFGTIARMVGFAIRRGRPGLLARMMQSLGAWRYHDWYVDNPHGMSRKLYATAKKRAEREIVADPERALSPEALRDLERYFAARARE